MLTRRAALLLAVGSVAASPAAAAPFEARIGDIRSVGPSVRTSIELRQVFSDKFKHIVEGGGALHVRVQAELWEARPIWDRLVRPAIVTVFRIVRDPSSVDITVSDAFGKIFSVAPFPEALPVQVD